MILEPTDPDVHAIWQNHLDFQQQLKAKDQPFVFEKYIPSDSDKVNFKSITMPRGLLVDGYIDEDGYQKLQLGRHAVEMEDKWNIYTDDLGVHFCRSWTGNEIYQFSIQNREGRHYIGYVNYEANPEQAAMAPLERYLDIFLATLAGTMGITLTKT